MAKQILIGITDQELSEIAHYLMIYFPYNEEMCSYTDAWMGELYENKYPLVAKGMFCTCRPRYATAEHISCSIKIKR